MLCSSQDRAVISHGARAALTSDPQGLETSGLGSRLQQPGKLCLKWQEHTGPLCKASGGCDRHRVTSVSAAWAEGTARTTDPHIPRDLDVPQHCLTHRTPNSNQPCPTAPQSHTVPSR